jgi:hypothetical protein
MITIQIELYAPGADQPFASKKLPTNEWPNTPTVNGILSKYFADIDPNQKVGKILICKLLDKE